MRKKWVQYFIFIVSIAVALFMASCGEDPIEDAGTDPKSRDGIEIGVGQTTQLSAAGVEFTIIRNGPGDGILVAHNRNSRSTEVLVERINGAGVALDETHLGSGESATNNSFDLTDGARYRFTVRVWKDGLDLLTCPFTEDSCFSSTEVKEESFRLPDQSA